MIRTRSFLTQPGLSATLATSIMTLVPRGQQNAYLAHMFPRGQCATDRIALPHSLTELSIHVSTPADALLPLACETGSEARSGNPGTCIPSGTAIRSPCCNSPWAVKLAHLLHVMFYKGNFLAMYLLAHLIQEMPGADLNSTKAVLGL